jgi:hypothetical protein
MTLDNDVPLARDEVAGWARRLSLKPAEKLVLLLLFDHAGPQKDGTWRAFPSARTLAKEAGFADPQTARKHMLELERKKIIRREMRLRENKSRTSNEVVLLACVQETTYAEERTPPAPDSAVPPALQSADQKPQYEAPVEAECSTSTNARATKPKAFKYRGRVVSSEIVSSAEVLLAEFNSLAGRKLAAFSNSGVATDALRQAVGALLAHPEATVDEWREGIRRVVEHPPGWTDGRALQPGDVFGPKAALHTLTPPPPPLNGNGRVNGNGRRETNDDLIRVIQEAKAQQRNGTGPPMLALPIGEGWA